MLALQVLEWLVLLHVLGFDLPRAELSGGGGIIEIYFWACTFTLILQVTGVLFVLQGRYRAGGILQLASCALHLPKGEGILGLLGGMKAIRYGRVLVGVGSTLEKSRRATETEG